MKPKLYRSPDLPDRWIGEDQDGALVHWPAERGGWTRRTPYTGGKRQLEECETTLGRGSGWPGGGRGPAPRSSSGASNKTIGIRVTAEERAKWERVANLCDKGLTVWARDELNEVADRMLKASASRPRSKG